MLKNELLKKLYREGSSSASLVFEHDAKVWVMPEDAVEGGMDMYQPSSRGGASIKKSIINNGGVLENEIVVDGVTEQRYWIG